MAKPEQLHPHHPHVTQEQGTKDKSVRSVPRGLSWADPEFTDRRKAALRVAWKDPEKYAARVARLHSQDAEESRRITLASHPDKKRNRLIAAIVGTKRAKAARIREKLGENPGEQLLIMHYEQGLTWTEISQRLGVGNSTLSAWKKDLGEDPEKVYEILRTRIQRETTET